jgi:predicted transglutaminase-like cysteine proteinase
MLRRVAALCFAVFIVVWPACAVSNTDTFWDTPSAAALVWKRLLAPPRQQTADAAEVKPEAESELRAQSEVHDDASRQTAALDPLEATVAAPPPQQQIAKLDPVEPTIVPPPPPPVSVPFGLAATPVAFGGILTKWTGVQAQIRAGNEILARCRNTAEACPKAAQIFLGIVAQGRAHDGLARVGVINRAVNMAIEPMSDMAQWGVPDRWSPPLETFTTGRGDCEDYAIAKYVALTAAGVSAQDVKLVVVRNTAANEDHAVVAVRNDGDWIILDNRWLMLLKDADLPNAIPLFVLDDDGAWQFEAPALVAKRQTAAPASAGL